MFINEPVLKSNKKNPKTIAKSINQYQFSSKKQPKQPQQSINQNNNNKDSKAGQLKGILKNKRSRISQTVKNDKQQNMKQNPLPYTQLLKQEQFEERLQNQLERLMKKWESNLANIKNSLQAYKNVKQTEAETKAFQHCIQILEIQFNNAEDGQEQQNSLIQKKQLQIDNYKLRLIKQIKQLKEQNKLLREQKQRFNQYQKQHEKKMANKNAIQQKIKSQKQKIQKLKKSMLECKQKSYDQKNAFIEIQTQQFKLETDIRQQQEQQQKYQEQLLRKQKYDQLKKIKQKVINTKNGIEEQIRPHIERKIQKMAKLRTQICSIDDALDICLGKIQDQNIIVQALKQKCYHQQAYNNERGSDNLFDNYYKKYNEIYFGEKNDKDAWKQYNVYLKHLVSRSKNLNRRVNTQIPKNYGTPKNNIHSNSQILDLRQLNRRNTGQKFFGDSTKISKNPEKYKDIQKKASNPTRFPRLVKLQGQPSEQSNIKKKVIQGIKANNNNSNKSESFELQSINSSDSKVSGEIIEVQFHKK